MKLQLSVLLRDRTDFSFWGTQVLWYQELYVGTRSRYQVAGASLSNCKFCFVFEKEVELATAKVVLYGYTE